MQLTQPDDLEEREKQALSRKYLQNPFSLKWSTVVALSQSSSVLHSLNRNARDGID